MDTETRYCSIDLELTGFDPARDEILEVGFVFFVLTKDGAKVTEEWSRVFKPSGPVHPKILGLTGIKPAELENAPKFSEHRDFLQDKLGDAVLLGHNIVLDVRFLEAFGINLSGQTIDTLDLVQWILPAHHSYNLENLMHTFGVSQYGAHRALADAKATVMVLERLLSMYQGFPEPVHEKAKRLLNGQEFLWLPFLDIALIPSPKLADSQTAPVEVPGQALPIAPSSVTVVPLEQSLSHKALAALNRLGQEALFVTASPAESLLLWRKGLAKALFPSEDTFSETKFQAWLDKPEHVKEEILFLLKVLVWRYTNWQHETILDLNLSFSGGQFRGSITEEQTVSENLDKLLCCDQATFLELVAKQMFHNRFVLISGLARFEQALSSQLGSRASWNKAIRSLRSIYNPETDTGETQHKDLIVDALAATDLFFGICLTVLRKLFPSGGYVKQEQLTGQPYEYQRLAVAAEHYISKLQQATELKSSKSINKIIDALQDFFGETENRVRWVEFSETACIFFTQPLDISSDAKAIAASTESLSFVDDSVSKEVLEFLLARLGLKFSLVFQPPPLHKPSLEIVQGIMLEESLVERANVKHLPAAFVFPNTSEIKHFYDGHFQELKQTASVFAERYSGGSNKISHNFLINPHSLLLATPTFLLKSKHKHLPVKTLVVKDISSKPSQHPYQQALEQFWRRQFEDFKDLSLLSELDSLLRLFYSGALESIVLSGELSISKRNLLEKFFQSVAEIEN